MRPAAWLVLLVAALAASLPARADDGPFVGPSAIALPDGLFAGNPIALGDLDGDGRPEVVTVGTLSKKATLVVLRHERGALAVASTVALEGEVSALLVVDLDGDGRAEVIVSDGEGSLHVRAVADGTSLGPPVTSAGTRSIDQLVSGDLDGDGRSEVIAVGEALAVLRQDPARPRAFLPPTVTPKVHGVGVALGDVDADGHLDVLVASSAFGGGVAVFAGDPAAPGGLAPPVATPLGARHPVPGGEPIGFATALAATDLDGDGKDEVVVTMRDHGEAWVLGPRAGARGALEVRSRLPLGRMPSALAVADVDGDGRPDLLGLGMLQDALTLLRRGADGAHRAPENHLGGNSPRALAAGDLDGDGRADVVLSCAVVFGSRGGLALVRGTEDGLAAPRSTVVSRGPHDHGSVQLVLDIDRDGRRDLVATIGEEVLVLRQDAAGAFGPPSALATGNLPPVDRMRRTHGLGRPAAGDLDGDGRLDLVVPCADAHAVLVLLQQERPGELRLHATLKAGLWPKRAWLADLDGDGRLDLLVTNHAQSLSVFLQDPVRAGALGEPVTVDVGAEDEEGEGEGELALADLDDDGRLDVALANGGHGASNRVLLLLQDGAGRGKLRPPVELGRGFVGGPIEARDVDLDLDLDLVVAERRPDRVTVLPRLAPGRFGPPAQHDSFSRHPGPLARDDVDADGRPDLLWLEADEQQVVLRLALAEGGFGSPQRLPAGRGATAVWLVDLEGDGVRELCVATSTPCALTVHRLRRRS